MGSYSFSDGLLVREVRLQSCWISVHLNIADIQDFEREYLDSNWKDPKKAYHLSLS